MYCSTRLALGVCGPNFTCAPTRCTPARPAPTLIYAQRARGCSPDCAYIQSIRSIGNSRADAAPPRSDDRGDGRIITTSRAAHESLRAWIFTIDVSENRRSPSLTTYEPEELSFNDPVAIYLVAKSNTLLDFEKRSFPLSLPIGR